MVIKYDEYIEKDGYSQFRVGNEYGTFDDKGEFQVGTSTKLGSTDPGGTKKDGGLLSQQFGAQSGADYSLSGSNKIDEPATTSQFQKQTDQNLGGTPSNANDPFVKESLRTSESGVNEGVSQYTAQDLPSYNPDATQEQNTISRQTVQLANAEAALAESARQTAAVTEGAGAEIEQQKTDTAEQMATQQGAQLQSQTQDLTQQEKDVNAQLGAGSPFAVGDTQVETPKIGGKLSAQQKMALYRQNKQAAALQKQSSGRSRTMGGIAGDLAMKAGAMGAEPALQAHYSRKSIEMEDKAQNMIAKANLAQQTEEVNKTLEATFGNDIPEDIKILIDPVTGKLFPKVEDIERNTAVRAREKLDKQRTRATEDYDIEYAKKQQAILAGEPNPSNPSPQTQRKLANLERDRKQFTDRMDEDIDDNMETLLLSEEATQESIIAKHNQQFTPEAILAQQQVQDKVDGINGIMDAMEDAGTPVDANEATKMYSASMSSTGGDKDLTAASVQAMKWVSSGEVGLESMASELLKMEGVNTAADAEKVLSAALPDHLVKDAMTEYWNSLDLPGEAMTANAQKTKNQKDFLEGNLDDTAGMSFIISADKDERELLLQTAKDNGVYAPESDMGKWIDAQIGGSGELSFEQQLIIPGLGKMIYGTRISDAETARIQKIMEDPKSDGLSRFDLAQKLLGFNVTQNEQLGESLMNTIVAGAPEEGMAGFDIMGLSQLLNSGKTEAAVRKVENFVSRQAKEIEGDSFISESFVAANMKKYNGVVDTLDKLGEELGIGVVQGTWAEWIGRAKSSDQKKLGAAMNSSVAKMRKELLGSAVTPAESAFLEDVIPKLTDTPEEIGNKLDNLKNNSLAELNSMRDVYGLPQLTEESLLDKKLKAGLYTEAADSAISQAGGAPSTPSSAFDFIKGFEGFSGSAYDDAGFKSIGYGTRAGNRLNVTRAEAQADAEAYIKNNITPVINKNFPNTNNNQRMAISSFLYNLGPNPVNSEVLFKAIQENDIPVIIEQWTQFNKSEGKVSAALRSRRASELAMYLTPEAAATTTATKKPEYEPKTAEQMTTDMRNIKSGLPVEPPQLKSVPEEIFGAIKDIPSDIGEGIDAVGKSFNEFEKKTEEISRAQGFDPKVNEGRLPIDYEKTLPEEQGALRSAWQTIGAGAGLAANIVGDVFSTLLKLPASENMEKIAMDAVGRIAPGLLNERVVGDVTMGDAIGAAAKEYETIQKENPALARDIDSAGGIAALVVEAVTLGKGSKIKAEAEELAETTTKQAVKAATPDAVSDLATNIKGIIPSSPKAAAPTINSKVNQLVEEAFIPATKVAPKGKSFDALQARKAKLGDGVIAVVNDKKSLEFFDNKGNIVKGKLPTSISEASQAVQQAKKARYELYSDIAKQAGDAPVSGEEIGTAIRNNDQFKTGMKALYDNGDDATIAAIEKQLARIESQEHTTEGLQSLIQAKTQDINAAMANGAQLNSADAAKLRILSELRTFQEDVITKRLGDAGGQYSALKKEYGALSDVETAINKRYAQLSTKTPGMGIMGATDVFSVGDLAYGIIASNPASIARAGAQAWVAVAKRNAVNPDKLIKRLFSETEKAVK